MSICHRQNINAGLPDPFGFKGDIEKGILAVYLGSRGEIYRRARREDVDLQQSMLFHSVSERVAADAEHASRLDLIAFSRIQGLLNQLFF